MTGTNNTTISKAKQPEKKSLKISDWLSISNLFLTAIVGIGIAIYLQYNQQQFQTFQLAQEQQFLSTQQVQQQNFQSTQEAHGEELQRQLIALQNKSNLASVLIYSYKSNDYGYGNILFPSTVIVKNDGPSIANNLRIVICLETLKMSSWKKAIQNIDSISVDVLDPAIIFTKTKIHSHCGDFADISEVNNAIEISIEKMPPMTRFSLALKIDENIKREPIVYSKPIEIVIPKALAPENILSDFNEFIGIYLQEYSETYLSVGSFSISTACENCSAGLNHNWVSIYAPTTWNITNLETIATPNSYKASFDYQTIILKPTSIESDDQTKVYLELIKLENSTQLMLLPISKEYFEQLTK